MLFEAESNSELTDRSGIPVAFPISGAKLNTQAQIFVGHPDIYLAVLLVLVIFCPLGLTNFKKSVI
jgi:hypothetical protein